LDLLETLPALPRDDHGPVFAEPWQAQAFAMTLALHEHGLFSWTEWAEALSTAIKAAQLAGDPDHGDTYYQHWLTALEQVVIQKGVSTDVAINDCRAAWDRAARSTPHGEPILLSNDPRYQGAGSNE
jgi:nitrile hydratase accessory protein